MKGWFRVPGIRPDGDRTLAEQMMGLEPALAEVKGKTVLDLGCAEGMISREFALAGAVDVHGIELLQTHLDVARKVVKGVPRVRLTCAHLAEYIKANPAPGQYDIVLVLGIIHKLVDPAEPLAWAARAARDLLLFRAPAKATDGIVRSKHSQKPVNVPAVMAEHGFIEEKLIPGVRGEAVQYWRRVAWPAESRVTSSKSSS